MNEDRKKMEAYKKHFQEVGQSKQEFPSGNFLFPRETFEDKAKNAFDNVSNLTKHFIQKTYDKINQIPGINKLAAKIEILTKNSFINKVKQDRSSKKEEKQLMIRLVAYYQEQIAQREEEIELTKKDQEKVELMEKDNLLAIKQKIKDLQAARAKLEEKFRGINNFTGAATLQVVDKQIKEQVRLFKKILEKIEVKKIKLEGAINTERGKIEELTKKIEEVKNAQSGQYLKGFSQSN